mgnify:FL=1|jgi:hypothetical protein
MTKAIAINPAKRKTKSKSNPKGGTVAKSKSKSKSKSRAKSNPTKPRAPRRNQAAFRITPTDARNLGMTAAGGAVGGAVTGYLDEMKPEALAMVPTELLTVGAGLLIVAMSKAPAAKAVASGMIGYAAGSMVEKFTADAAATVAPEVAPEKGLGALYGLQSPRSIAHNPVHRRATNVGALISVI